VSARVRLRTYQDFVIRIEPANEGVYRVKARASVGEETTTFTRPFEDQEILYFLEIIGHPRSVLTRGPGPKRRQMTLDFGKRLFNAVISGPVRDLYTSALQDARRNGKGLRLQLRLAEAEELADLPWEFLYYRRRFLALQDSTPVVRYLDLPNPPRPMRVEPPLRILVTISAPDHPQPLNVEGEAANVRQALAPLHDRGLVEIDFAPDARLFTLDETMRKADNRGSPYHVWHYIGHGEFYERHNSYVLLFCDQANRCDPVDGFDLGNMFGNYPEMRLVLLNTCLGARPDPKDPFAGVAAALVESGIPAVIGMQFEIRDDAAIPLAKVFYEAIADGTPVDTALTQARRAVYSLHQGVDWATPVLFMRSPDGQIFDVAALEQPVPRAREVVLPKEPDRQKLDYLYTEGLEAYLDEDWARAVEFLSDVVCLEERYEDAAEMLEDARSRHHLAEHYRQGLEACDSGAWGEAIEHLKAVLSIDPKYGQAEARLAEAERQRVLADWYARARQLHRARKWQAVVKALERIAAMEPSYPDPEGLLASSRAELKAQKLATLYRTGLRHIKARKWPEALELLEELQQLQPSYKKTEMFLAQIREELEEAKRQQQLAEHYRQGIQACESQAWVKTIEHLEAVLALDADCQDAAIKLAYARGSQACESRVWVEAIEHLEAVLALDAGYGDATIKLLYARGSQACASGAWAEAVEQLEAVLALDAEYEDAPAKLDEAKRQTTLAKFYDKARQAHKAKRWSAVIDLFEDIRKLDPSYPDPDGLLSSAEKARELASSYDQALRHLDAKEWAQAIKELKAIEQREPRYRDTKARLAQAQQALLHPSLSLKLSVKPQTVEIRQKATWTVTLRNDGDDELRDVNLKRRDKAFESPFDLAAGRGRRFTFTTSYQTKGEQTETVTATGIGTSGKQVRDEACATLLVRPAAHPSLSLKLSVKPQTAEIGQKATWTASLHNDGDADLQGVTVQAGRQLLAKAFTLAAGRRRRFTFTRSYRAEGEKTVQVKATGVDSNGNTVHDKVKASLQVRAGTKPKPQLKPSIAVSLSPGKPVAAADGKKSGQGATWTVQWTVTVRNDGNDRLRNVRWWARQPDDPPKLTRPLFVTTVAQVVLEPGEQREFTFTTSHTNLSWGTKIIREVTAYGIASEGREVQDHTSAEVQVTWPLIIRRVLLGRPSIAVSLSPGQPVAAALGKKTGLAGTWTVQWTVTVRNDGNDRLRNVRWEKKAPGLSGAVVATWAPQPDSPSKLRPLKPTADQVVLAPGEQRDFTFTTTHTLAQLLAPRAVCTVTAYGIASDGSEVRDETSASLPGFSVRSSTP
jgi:outer membrane protein assembly factor BamD (BamD/ComL family)